MMKNTIHKGNLFQVVGCSLIACFFASLPVSTPLGWPGLAAAEKPCGPGCWHHQKRTEGTKGRSHTPLPNSQDRQETRGATYPAQQGRGVGSRAGWASPGPSRLEGSASSGGYRASAWTPGPGTGHARL